MLFMTEEGVMRGTALHRRPEEERWTTEGWEKLCGTPWEMRPSARGEMEFALPIERPEVPMLTETDERPFQRRS
eukprot:9605088-Karenia_brevis.AAC.1